MALNTGSVVAELDGMETVDPSFGMPARWVASARRTEAEAMGYVVVEPTTVVATHLLVRDDHRIGHRGGHYGILGHIADLHEVRILAGRHGEPFLHVVLDDRGRRTQPRHRECRATHPAGRQIVGGQLRGGEGHDG